MSESKEMISTSEAQEFIPLGRQHASTHPGKVPLQLRAGSVPPDHGLPLVKALRDFTLKDKVNGVISEKNINFIKTGVCNNKVSSTRAFNMNKSAISKFLGTAILMLFQISMQAVKVC